MTEAVDLIPHMRSVVQCEKQLDELKFTWRLIETTAKMVCPSEAKTILPSMAGTREAFGQLETQLVATLANENLNKVAHEIAGKAQVVVDIVIRNLFERTADVGFLATDTDIRRFLRGDGVSREAIEQRLREYIAKYSVYDEILVLSPDGEVRAHLEAANRVGRSHDPLIAQTLAADDYVETFRKTDLLPARARALIYSRRIDDEDGEALGVLCLSFRFDNEMDGIFRAFRRKHDRSLMLLLDAEGVVIASSDEDHVAVGKTLQVSPDGRSRVLEFGGREYIASTCRTHGYQGYTGLGWLGHVMVPVDVAFREPRRAAAAPTEPALDAAGQADMLCDELRGIGEQASHINLSLRRLVWNGQVMSSGRSDDLVKLKSVLQQISETGERMRSVFAGAMRDLSETVISTSLHDLQFVSRLMIDIMDRNLYERANDCRWWALSSEIRHILARESVDAADAARIADILTYINGLYTVYARLYVYDAQGRILAASDPQGDGIAAVGHTVDAATLARVGKLGSTQEYCVSPFAPTPLYGDRPTYVYHAAIRHPIDAGAIVGGIGIVFDGEREFRAMLQDALPRRAGTWAAYCDRDGRVIASSRDDLRPGQMLELAEDLRELGNGAGVSARLTLAGRPHLVGATLSSGYREYKNSGDYQNDVIALVALPLSEGDIEAAPIITEFTSGARAGEGEEYALFLLRDRYLAVAAESVLEAAEVADLNRFGASGGQIIGVIPFGGGHGETQFVPVLSLNDFFNLPSGEPRGQIIITRSRHGHLGLLVDELLQVVEFEPEAIKPIPDIMGASFRWIRSLISANGGQHLVTAIDPEAIYEMLRDKIKGQLDALAVPQSTSAAKPAPLYAVAS